MTEEERDDLTRKVFTGSLNEADRDGLVEGLREDPAFRDNLRFDLAMADAAERARFDAVERERVREERAETIRKIALYAGALILVALAVLFLYRTLLKADEAPFTPEEGRELLEDVIAEARSQRRLGTFAGTISWTDDLSNSPLTSERLDSATVKLERIVATEGICDDLEVAYFLGAIRLYAERDYTQAYELFRCADQDPDFAYPEQLDLPIILSDIGQHRIERAKVRFQQSGLTLEELPLGARETLAINSDTE